MHDARFFSSEYIRLCEQLAVGEPQAAFPEPARLPVRERLVRCFWFDQNLTTDDLRTEDGRKLRVLSPGWWNLEAGPDFRNAVIRLANEPIVKGDVELHVDAADWYNHGHDRDPAYDSVILHVALRNERGDPTVRNSRGEPVPQLALEPYLAGGLGELAETVNPEDYPESADCSVGLCNVAIRENAVDGARIGLFLDYAGDQRALAKMQKWERLVNTLGAEAAVQAGVMEALGFKKNKSQFALLARLAPPSKLKALLAGLPADEKRLRAEAALFGLAGLLETAKNDDDPEAAGYIAALRQRWEGCRASFPEGGMDGKQWILAGSRPANFPTRRIAAAAAFLAEHVERGLVPALLACLPPETGTVRAKDVSAARRNLENLFTGAAGPGPAVPGADGGFWLTRCTFEGKRLPAAIGLVGKDRAALIIINVVIPILLLHARRNNDADLEELLHTMYVKMPRLAPTNVEAFMVQRVFGGDEFAAKVISNARRQQGIYQVFKDFCEKDDRGCRRCAVLASLSKRA